MSRSKSTFHLPLEINKEGKQKRQHALETLRSAITSGRLQSGDQIPSSRDLAKQWSISRSIIVDVYEELQAEGLLLTKRGAGTFVSAPRTTHSPTPTHSPAPASQTFSRIQYDQPFVARQADVKDFPIETWRKLATKVLGFWEEDLFHHDTPAGDLKLREQIARYLGFARGISCTANDIIITTGIRQSIDMCLRTFLHTKMPIALESPGYLGLLPLADNLGIPYKAIDVDIEGMQVSQLQPLATAISTCFVTPSHQSPLGVELSLERRKELLNTAAENDFYIFEDDYDGEFFFETSGQPALKSMDQNQRVIHAGTFNKSLFPTLRIGYLIPPPQLRDSLIGLRHHMGRSNSALDQRILAHFIQDGHFARYIRKMKALYSLKCQKAIQTLQSGYGQELEIIGAHGGFHFFLKLPETIKSTKLKSEAEKIGIDLQVATIQKGLQTFEGAVIGYASLDIKKIEECGIKLGRLMHHLQEAAK